MYKVFNEYCEISIFSVEILFELLSFLLFYVLVVVINIILLVWEGLGFKKKY